MSGPQKDAPEKSVQDFLQRWSRRKLGIAEADDAAQPSEPSQSGEPDSAPPPEPAETVAAARAAFDPKSLPPIESIDATTDIRAFLAPGVPVELTRAALRRAWTSDPAIRDFVGIAENQWDFTNPDAVPGFGSLEFTEEVRAMVSRLFGDEPPTATESSDAVASIEATPSQRAPPPLAGESRGSGDETQASMDVSRLSPPIPDASPQGRGEDDAAPQNESHDAEREHAQRTHGGALPK
jgi:uncharacterized protein DUF3306